MCIMCFYVLIYIQSVSYLLKMATVMKTSSRLLQEVHFAQGRRTHLKMNS